MAPCEFQTLPLRLFNWDLIKTLKTKWWVVPKEPLCITPASGIFFVHQMEPVTNSECREAKVIFFEMLFFCKIPLF